MAKRSQPFEFIVEGQSFFVHADLCSQFSKPLDRLMNGKMREAQDKSARIEEVDSDTFERFVEWLYKGTYTPALHSVPTQTSVLTNPAAPTSNLPESSTFKPVFSFAQAPRDEPSVPSVPTPQTNAQTLAPQHTFTTTRVSNTSLLSRPPTAQPTRRISGPLIFEARPLSTDPHPGITVETNAPFPSLKQNLFSPPTQPPKSVKETLKESFVSRKCSVRQNVIELPPARANLNANEDYTEVLLSHARLYVFADQYDVQKLKILALDELQLVLAVFTLYPSQTGSIVALLRYVCSHTPSGSSVFGSTEPMRAMLKQYVGFEMDILMADANFREALREEDGGFLDDFLKMVGQRLGP